MTLSTTALTLPFLSTPSARRATLHRVARFQAHEISIHALREEGDRSHSSTWVSALPFLSTPSTRRATNRRAEGSKQ